jgi:hypothetical protein
MELTKDMELYFEKLQTLCNLKEGVSVRDDNERNELLHLLRLLRLEIQSIDHNYTLNILYNKTIPEEDITKTIQEIIQAQPEEIKITLTPDTPHTIHRGVPNMYRDGQALFHTPDGRTFTDAREADKHIQQLWRQEED